MYRVIVIHKKNEGLSEARNDGLSFSSGDCIAFVDSDDYILPKMYQDMVACKHETNCDIIVCQWQWEDRNGIWTVDHTKLASSKKKKKNGFALVKFD